MKQGTSGIRKKSVLREACWRLEDETQDMRRTCSATANGRFRSEKIGRSEQLRAMY